MSKDPVSKRWLPRMIELAASALRSPVKPGRPEDTPSQNKWLQDAVLDSLAPLAAVVDREGEIISTNRSWVESARRNGAQSESSIGSGANYLNVCCRAAAAGCQQAADAAAGIRGVCGRTMPSFELEYPCHAPANERWFLMTVTPLLVREGGAVITHTDISNLKRAEICLRESEEQSQELGGRLIEAQEEERSRIAAELHDNLSQKMALVSIEMEMLAQAAAQPAPEIVAGLRDVLVQVQQLTSEIHRLSYELHPAKLDRLGLAAASIGLCKEISQKQSVQMKCAIENIPDSLPPHISLCLYRVLQESLNNIVKHSGACKAAVELHGSHSGILLSVADEGVGFDLESSLKKGGVGLLGMRERLRHVGGTISIASQPSQGTRISVTVPIASARPEPGSRPHATWVHPHA